MIPHFLFDIYKVYADKKTVLINRTVFLYLWPDFVYLGSFLLHSISGILAFFFEEVLSVRMVSDGRGAGAGVMAVAVSVLIDL